MHIAPAFSCLEILDAVYYGLMARDDTNALQDIFVMSKGHGCMAQYAILEDLGILTPGDLEEYCTPDGMLGGHPDFGVPGIAASTGSLGHGLSISLGMAYAEKIAGTNRRVFAVIGDGEMQEGSIWEAIMLTPNLDVRNLVCFLDLNDFQGLGRTSELHPHFYPVAQKLEAFGWQTAEVNGHDTEAIHECVRAHSNTGPLFVVARTVKGKGVDFMENVPIWHYRSPNPEEYRYAMDNLSEVTE
ncbi:transketolase [Rhodospirillaceae bacterium KN72]|uniref:Transketolase n=1 Tax=Pacificispira spongiicola TaxID=2729598 RepID=A0A7Y0E3W5_9PROT|nr:transketolase [Pacificispira spongiicola]NMM46724.1 transketolase [Pacificispira spongiicola]